jgi:hypothetical protein
LLPLLLAGCATTLTNLTSSRQVRNANGLYPIEVSWHSRNETIINDTIKPCVMVGVDCFEMKRTALVSNRWEALVPVPKSQKSLNYRFRFDYEYKAFGGRQQDSKLSTAYTLLIVDK